MVTGSRPPGACSGTLFGSLKVERLPGQKFETRRQAKDEVIGWLLWYNRASAALEAGLRQPDEVRAGLACQSTEANHFVTQLWRTKSRGKIKAVNLLQEERLGVGPGNHTRTWRKLDEGFQAHWSGLLASGSLMRRVIRRIVRQQSGAVHDDSRQYAGRWMADVSVCNSLVANRVEQRWIPGRLVRLDHAVQVVQLFATAH